MRVLVTGGCGFVGTNLIAYIRESNRDYQIHVIDNESLGSYSSIKEFGVEFFKGEFDGPLLDQALEGVDAVVHLAADTRVIESIENPVRNFQTNVVGTFNLLQKMRENDVKRIVCASTGGAILGEVPPPVHEEMAPNPSSPYGASKLMLEGYCSAYSASYGFQTACLRFSNVYGPFSFHKGSVVAHFFKQIMQKKDLIVYGDGSQTRDYVYSFDLCQGILNALTRGKSGVFQLGTGIPTSINQLIENIFKVVGEDFEVPVQYHDFRAGEIRATYCNINRAKKTLGYNPDTPLLEGLTKSWKWFQENYGERYLA